MKLNLVPARTGIMWVKLGIQTFFRRPLALAGLFMMFIAAMSIASLVPLLGNLLVLMLVPASTLGLMAATREASEGQMPMPTILVTAFRAGRQRLNAMLVLGALYAGGFLLVLGLSALVDGGSLARLFLVGDNFTRETVTSPDFQLAARVCSILGLPLSLLFWHAPALVHWHGVPPVKSLFFSAVACLRNFWAYTVFSLAWGVVFMVVGIVMAVVAGLLSDPMAAPAIAAPVGLALAAMLFTSFYFTFRDSFQTDAPTDLPADAPT